MEITVLFNNAQHALSILVIRISLVANEFNNGLFFDKVQMIASIAAKQMTIFVCLSKGLFK